KATNDRHLYGALLVRVGRGAEALPLLESGSAARNAWPQLFRALARLDADQRAEAQECLERAASWMPPMTLAPSPGPWHDRVGCAVVLREIQSRAKKPPARP